MAEKKEKQGKKGGKKLLILIIVAVVVLIGGGAAAYFLIFAKKEPPPEEEVQAPVEEKAEIGPFLPLDPFVVNLAGPGRRYLKVKVTLEMADNAAYDEAQDRIPQVMDAILMVLSSKTPEEVTSVEGKIELRAEMITKLNQVLGPGKVRNVYFSQFVVQ